MTSTGMVASRQRQIRPEPNSRLENDTQPVALIQRPSHLPLVIGPTLERRRNRNLLTEAQKSSSPDLPIPTPPEPARPSQTWSSPVRQVPLVGPPAPPHAGLAIQHAHSKFSFTWRNPEAMGLLCGLITRDQKSATTGGLARQRTQEGQSSVDISFDPPTEGAENTPEREYFSHSCLDK